MNSVGRFPYPWHASPCRSVYMYACLLAGDITQQGFEKKRSKLLAPYVGPGGLVMKSVCVRVEMRMCCKVVCLTPIQAL